MKKIRKIWLASSISLLSLVAITPMLVSCSQTPTHGEWDSMLINDSNLIQKGIYENREISKEQCDFSIHIYPYYKEKIFIIDKYLGNNWNYYASEYDDIEGKDEDIVSSKSNTLIIPNKIMYNNEWYTFAGWNRDFGFFPDNNSINNKLKSIRFDSNIIHSINGIIDPKWIFINLLDIQNYPLLTRNKLDSCSFSFKESGDISTYKTPYINLQGSINFRELTFNTKVKSIDSDPENLIAMPILKTAKNFTNYEIPNEVNTILTGTFTEVTYNGFQIGDNIKIIEPKAFRNEAYPTSLIPERFYKDKISKYFFTNMTIDNSFLIPSTCQNIGSYSFNRCKFENSNFIIPEGVTWIGEYAFQDIVPTSSSIEGITFYLPDSLEQLYEPSCDNNDGFPFYCGTLSPLKHFNLSFVVKSERVKNLLIDAAKKNYIDNFEEKVKITIDPNWEQNI